MFSEVSGMVVTVPVSFAVSQTFHEASRCVAEVERDGFVGSSANILQGVLDGPIRRVALGT